MTAQLSLPVAPAGAVPVGRAAALVQDDSGGRVFINGQLSFAWDAGDEMGPRFAAVQLVRIKAAHQYEVGRGVRCEHVHRVQVGASTHRRLGVLPGVRRPAPSLSRRAVARDRCHRPRTRDANPALTVPKSHVKTPSRLERWT
jgi:hypothetical protein